LLERAFGYLDRHDPDQRAIAHFETELARITGVHGAKPNAATALGHLFGRLPSSRPTLLKLLARDKDESRRFSVFFSPCCYWHRSPRPPKLTRSTARIHKSLLACINLSAACAASFIASVERSKWTATTPSGHSLPPEFLSGASIPKFKNAIIICSAPSFSMPQNFPRSHLRVEV